MPSTETGWPFTIQRTGPNPSISPLKRTMTENRARVQQVFQQQSDWPTRAVRITSHTANSTVRFMTSPSPPVVHQPDPRWGGASNCRRWRWREGRGGKWCIGGCWPGLATRGRRCRQRWHIGRCGSGRVAWSRGRSWQTRCCRRSRCRRRRGWCRSRRCSGRCGGRGRRCHGWGRGRRCHGWGRGRRHSGGRGSRVRRTNVDLQRVDLAEALTGFDLGKQTDLRRAPIDTPPG